MSIAAAQLAAREQAQQATVPVVKDLEEYLNSATLVDFAEIDPDTGVIYLTTRDGVELTVKVEAGA